MLVFISGPYRGQTNPHGAFNDAARRLWRLGAVPFNPIVSSEIATDFMADDDFIARYCDAIQAGCFSAIYMLQGWNQSVGARDEWTAAHKAGCVPVYSWWCNEAVRWALEKRGVIPATKAGDE